MADTIRQKLIDLIVARMQTILVANGYETDAGARIEDWPRRFDESELPALAICDVSETSDKGDRESGLEMRMLTVQVRILVGQHTPARTLRRAIGDVQKAVGVDQYWPDASGVPLSTGTWPRRAGMIVPGEAMEVAGAAVEFDVQYQTETFNPYQ